MLYFSPLSVTEDSRGPLSVLIEITKFLVLYLVILWMSLRGETFNAYPRLIRWTFPQFIINVSYARARAHREVASKGPPDDNAGSGVSETLQNTS